MGSFKSNLKNLSPEHDTPVGLIHPYWARKPLNVVQALITCFSKDGDVIVDPFVGSGTSVFAALTQGRNVIAADLNPLAIFLTSAIMELCQEPEQKLAAIHHFLEDFSRDVLPWYHYQDNLYVERERFNVDGEFQHGKFDLIPSEVVLKRINGNGLKGRIVRAPNTKWRKKTVSKALLTKPINFKKLKLLPNSRIAIPDGATLAHYYERKNQAAINLALNLIASEKYGSENSNVLKLLLSASLPLLRLSDKKASSQWPYWRPKTHLTSRNPVVVFQDKLKAIQQAATWLQENIGEDERTNLTTRLRLYNTPIQRLIPNYADRECADLVITDPPYSDQAPYLEYSSLWIQILGLTLPAEAYKHEIVKTDAQDRIEDSREYTHRLEQGFQACSDLTKSGGILIWFYQDHVVEHWAVLDEAAVRNNLSIVEVIPMPKQRRSMKTVTSPGKTLDGDLILVFKKNAAYQPIPDNVDKALQLLDEAQQVLPSSATFFERYASIVEVGLRYHLMRHLAQSFDDIREILQSVGQGENNVLAT